MTMLDQNRARAQLARKDGAGVSAVTNLAIWGNHSATMYPDYLNARIGGLPAPDVIADQPWFTDTFIPLIQKRGAAIIEARGASSAASAANAVVDTVRALTTPTRPGDCFSAAVCSDGAYGVAPGLVFSLPLRSDGTNWSVIADLPVNESSRARLNVTEAELKEERSLVSALLQP